MSFSEDWRKAWVEAMGFDPSDTSTHDDDCTCDDCEAQRDSATTTTTKGDV